MKQMYTWPLLFVSALVLAGCGSDEGDTQAPAPAAPQPEEAFDESRPMIEQYEVKMIDHSRDEKEFELRKTLNGVESMLEDGIGDEAALKKQKAELEKELKALMK
ncbi:MAG: hypothetical protein WDZ86_06865 [Gammaproteobacteria bacterium]